MPKEVLCFLQVTILKFLSDGWMMVEKTETCHHYNKEN